MDVVNRTIDYEDLGDFLDVLRDDGDLLEIDEEVDPRFEMGAVLRVVAAREGPAVLFTNVARSAGKIVAGNVLGHRRRAARAFGVGEADLVQTYLCRRKERIPPERTESAPVLAVQAGGDDPDLLEALPALTHHEKDSSPYLTCGVTLARDLETGKQSMGLHRIQIQSKNRMAICLASPPLSFFLEKAKRLNRPLEVATVLGVDPAVLLASVTWSPEGNDKLEIAGAFRGKPVEVVRCRTVDLLVPARAQFLLEGVIQPGETASEGVFGESSGIYVQGSQSPVIRVQAVFHSKRPIFQALQPWTMEDDILFNLCFGSDLLDDLRKRFGFVKDLHLIAGTVGAHAVISVDENRKPLIRSALAALMTGRHIKMAIVVNSDINIREPREVAWAMATRFQGDRDLIIMPGLHGLVIDPSAGEDASVCKVGIDATFPKGRSDTYQRINVQEKYCSRALHILERASGDFNEPRENKKS